MSGLTYGCLNTITFSVYKAASVSEGTAVMHGDVEMLLPFTKSPQSEKEK